MTLKKLRFKLTGTAPLLLHNGQTADPLNPYSKALKQISSKRKKTDADYMEMQKIEWYSAIYVKNDRLIVPSDLLEACFVAGAKKSKLGNLAKAGVFIEDHSVLNFEDDNLSIDELWSTEKYLFACPVKIGTNKVVKARFKVKEWSLEGILSYQDKVINLQQIKDALLDAGEQCGIGTWRPKHGRFLAEF